MKRMVLLSLALAGCEAMETGGSWLPPTAPPAAEPATEVAPALDEPVAADAVEPEVDEPEQAPVGADAPSDAELLAMSMGIKPAPRPTTAAPVADPMPATAPNPAPTAERASWGVRLVSTLPHTQPPRAVLALPSGEEVVVTPGTFVERARLVVMAIGPDTVHVSRIIPHGDSTQVEDDFLTPLYGRTAAPQVQEAPPVPASPPGQPDPIIAP